MVRDYTKVSKETRKKISLSKLGIKRPDVSIRFKGVPKTEEHKKKLSDALKGCKSPNWGKRFSKETIKKMSKAQKGRRLGIKRPDVSLRFKGIPLTEEHKMNIRLSKIGKKRKPYAIIV